MKRPLFWAGAVFLSATASFLCLSFPAALICCAAIIGFVVFLSQSNLKLGALIFLFVSVLAACWTAGYNLILDRRVIPVCSGETTVHMTVLSTYQNGKYNAYTGRATLELDGSSYTANSLTIAAFTDLGARPGDILSCVAEVSLERSDNILSARELQIAYKLDYYLPEASPNRFNPHPFTKLVAGLRGDISEALSSLSEDDDVSGLLMALVIGDRSGMSPTLNTDFQKSGMSHLVVVSGLHLTMMYAMVAYLLTPIKKGWLKSLLAIAFCWFFALLTGFGSSVVRAAVMLTVAEAGRLLNRQGDLLTSLAFCCIIMTAINPYTVLSLGFLLSVGSVAGLAVFAAPIEKALVKPSQNGAVVFLMKSAAVSFSAQLGAALPLLFSFGSLPLLGVVANIPAVPLSNFIIVAAIVGAVLSFLIPPVGTVVGIVAAMLSRLLIIISQIVAAIPFSQFNLTERYQTVWFIGFYLLLAVITTRQLTAVFKARCLLGACVAGLLCAVISLSLNLGSIDVLVTEQSDCVVIIKGGHAVMVGTPRMAGEPRRLADAMARLGVNKLDAAILPDFNSAGPGLSSVMKAFDCELLISRAAPSTLAFCLANGFSLSPLEEEMLLLNGISAEFNQEFVSLSLKENSKIHKTSTACDIISPSSDSMMQIDDRIKRVRFQLEG